MLKKSFFLILIAIIYSLASANEPFFAIVNGDLLKPTKTAVFIKSPLMNES